MTSSLRCFVLLKSCRNDKAFHLQGGEVFQCMHVHHVPASWRSTESLLRQARAWNQRLIEASLSIPTHRSRKELSGLDGAFRTQEEHIWWK